MDIKIQYLYYTYLFVGATKQGNPTNNPVKYLVKEDTARHCFVTWVTGANAVLSECNQEGGSWPLNSQPPKGKGTRRVCILLQFISILNYVISLRPWVCYAPADFSEALTIKKICIVIPSTIIISLDGAGRRLTAGAGLTTMVIKC